MPTNTDVESTELASLLRQELKALRLLAVERCPETLASKHQTMTDLQASTRQSAAVMGGKSHRFCVVTWNVAGIPLDDLDVWLQQVCDHIPWDVMRSQEGLKRLDGIDIKVGRGIFTPCRLLGGLRSPAITVRSGSVCDDVEFLVADTRWLTVRSESLKLIFLSLHVPHRRISVEDYMSIIAGLREALLVYFGAYRFRDWC